MTWDPCPGCGGPPMIAHGYNTTTKKYDVPEECPHLCPVRAESGDYEVCRCCKACMNGRKVCEEKRTG